MLTFCEDFMETEESLSNEDRYALSTRRQLELSQNEKEPYEIELRGKKFVVYPDVFSPKYFKDTEFFAETVRCKPNEKFLEIGAGIGAISVFAAMQGANVTVTDINFAAIGNIVANLNNHSVLKRSRVLHGDVYSCLKLFERFDTIFWNVPFIYTEETDFSPLESAVFNPRYDSIRRFISGAREHLTEEGRLLIGFSKTIGRFSLLKRILKENKFSFSELAQRNIDYGSPIGEVSLELYEARRQNDEC